MHFALDDQIKRLSHTSWPPVSLITIPKLRKIPSQGFFFFPPNTNQPPQSPHPNHLLYPAFLLGATIRLPSSPHCQGPDHSGRIYAPGPGGTSGKEPACQSRRLRRQGFDLWVGRRKWQPTPVFLSGESHGQRSLYSMEWQRVRDT